MLCPLYPSPRNVSPTNLKSFPLLSPSMDDHQKKKKKRKRALTIKVKNVNEGVVCNGSRDIEDFSLEETLGIRKSLLRWYYEHQRVLPWRVNQCDEEEERRGEEREARAYAVWVSEVMLQQTQVATVIDYYNRWMAKWPSVHRLAQASQEEVNGMWAGLGYYRRARFLLEGAKSIVEAGGFPRTDSALQNVRGIGKYTAGAIASMAFKEAVPVVDGNVIRVLARLKAISANPKEAKTIKEFWKLAAQLVDGSVPGDFNQALMELGATVCTPAKPDCSICPVSSRCRALKISQENKSVLVTDYPMKVVKAKQRLEFVAVCIVEITEDRDIKSWKSRSTKGNSLILVKRPDEGLLAGLWEFPSAFLEGEEDNSSTRRNAMDQYLKASFNLDVDVDGEVVLRKDVGEYVHIFSHIRLRMYIELLVLYMKGGAIALKSKGNQTQVVWKCIDEESIRTMGLTSGVRKVYSMVADFKRNGLSKLSSRTSKKRRGSI